MPTMTVIEALEDALNKLIEARGWSCECPEDGSTVCDQCRYREALEAAKQGEASTTTPEAAPMTLGQQLAQQQARSKAEQIAEQERIARQADAEKQRKYNDMQRYFQGVQEKLVEQIVEGKTEPRVSTKDDRKISWLFHESTTKRTFIGTETPGFCHEESPYYPLWLDFKAWAKENDLILTTHFEHDGCGMESWYSFRVKPKTA